MLFQRLWSEVCSEVCSKQASVHACADPHADEMRSYAAQVPVVTYAMHNKNADVYQEKMRFSLWETEVTMLPLRDLSASQGRILLWLIVAL